jgi:retron-type reverse transcriptase
MRHDRDRVFGTDTVGLVCRWLKAGIGTEDGLRRSVTTGTPQGGVISPLLANVYLHRLDVEATKAGLRFVRYCDDFVVTANRRWKACRADPDGPGAFGRHRLVVERRQVRCAQPLP